MSLLLAVGGGGAAYSLSGAAGAYVLTGQAATFKVGHGLPGAPGAYSLTGHTGGFTVAHVLAGAVGAYALNGQAGTFGYVSGVVGVVAAGAGSKSLAEYEAEWRDRPTEGPPAKVQKRATIKAAREVYFPAYLPDVAQVYVDRLKAQKESARVAEVRAWLDLQEQTSALRADIARAAISMAQRKQAKAKRELEEFDVMYVAAVLESA